jgi:cysteine-S-conjugate beta-lyase
VGAVRERVDAGDTGYAHPGGLPEAYAAFSDERYGWAPDPGRIAVVHDVMRAVEAMLLLFTEPGDGVVVNSPVYPPFFSTIRHAGRRVVEAPVQPTGSDGRYELDLEAVERAFAGDGATAYLLCNPHNPTGRVPDAAELGAVAEVADRHGATVISDEVHAPLTASGCRHVPFGSLDAPAARRSVSLVSASKGWNIPGLKCALVVAGPDAWPTVAALPDEVTEPSILGVAANEAAFRDGLSWLDDTLAYLDGNRRALADALAARVPAIRWHPPEATYLAWLDCRALGLGDDPSAAFLERGRVALVAGPDFGAPGAGFARLNFATSRSIVLEAVDRMAAVATGQA